MTSLPVNDIGLITPMVNDTNGVSPAGKTGGDFMGSLKTAIETQSTALNIVPADSTQVAASQTKQTLPTDREVEQVDRPVNTGKTDDNRESVKNEVKKEAGRDTKNYTEEADTVDEETVEAVGEVLIQIVNEVSKELEVEPEVVLTAMEELDMNATDLLNPSNMADLVSQISGDQDTLNLLTDENLYQTLSNLQEYVSNANADLRQTLDLSQEALNEVLVQTEELNGQEIAENIMSGLNITEETDTADEGAKDYKVTVTVDGERVSLDVEVDSSTGVASVAGIQKQTGTHSGDSSDTQGREKNSDTHIQGHEITQTTQQNNDINTNDVFVQNTEEISSFRTDPSDVANQIMESMRANLRENVTELEMTLHPATLGNVRVNLVSQNGQVTAQFLTQNESVRAAIESQIVQLKESLESQGVKIEAVEVTVASHEFDQNSDTAGQHQDEMAREEARGRLGGRRRSIDLNAITDESELAEMDEADRITAEMMASEGNKVNYTV